MHDFTLGLVKKPPISLHHGLVPKEKKDGKSSSEGAKQESSPKSKELTHPSGKVTGIDEETGLPIVRRESPAVEHSERSTQSVEHRGTIGKDDPTSKRKVLHADSDPTTIASKAKAEHQWVKDDIHDAISTVKGATLHGSRDEKPVERVKEKLEKDKQPANTIPDYSGFRVAVDSHDAHMQAAKAIKDRFKVVKDKDEFEKGAPDTGFHSHMLQVQRPGSEVSHEVQVLPKQVADAAESTHDEYEKARTGDKQAQASLKAKNESAWKEFEDSQHKYKFGNTQANLPPDSEAHKAIRAFQDKIPNEHLAGDGKDVDDPHVTVRYGIQGDSKDKIREFIKRQKPFVAKLGKTASFPPTEHSDGAAPLHAPVNSPELHKLNSEIEKHGDFAPSSFPDYKPHVTIAYVKPEAVAQHVGKSDTEGKTFNVNSISISDRDGNKEDVPMLGNQSSTEGGRGESPEPKAGGDKPSASELKKGDEVRLQDGQKATVAYVPPQGATIAVYRFTTDGGKPVALRASQVANGGAVKVKDDAPDDGKGVILVDFDKTLVSASGKPEAAMVYRIKRDLAAGKTVKIFTAEVANDDTGQKRREIQRWSKLHLGRELPITNKKMHNTAEILDDKAFHVAPNTGEVVTA